MFQLLCFIGLVVNSTLSLASPVGVRTLKNNSNLKSENLSEQIFSPSQHVDCRWSEVSFESSKLDQLQFRRCNLRIINFHAASLKNLDVHETKMEKINFKDADLRGSYWLRNSCLNCDFRGADLRESFFLLNVLTDSLFDSKTQLPFDRVKAAKMGLVYVD